MVRTAGASTSEATAQKGKKKVAAAGGGGRPPSVAKSGGGAGAKGKKGSVAKKKRTSDVQLRQQIAAVKALKTKLKIVVEKFDAAYPEGVDFTPGAKRLDLM